jgi:hypothetical protein
MTRNCSSDRSSSTAGIATEWDLPSAANRETHGRLPVTLPSSWDPSALASSGWGGYPGAPRVSLSSTQSGVPAREIGIGQTPTPCSQPLCNARGPGVCAQPRANTSPTATRASAPASVVICVRDAGRPRIARRLPADSTEPSEPAESSDATEPAEPTENAEAIEPTEPMERTEPAEPIERTEPSDPIERTDPCEATDKRDLLMRSSYPHGPFLNLARCLRHTAGFFAAGRAANPWAGGPCEHEQKGQYGLGQVALRAPPERG